MKVGLWAEIRRLAEIEKLSRRQIALRLHCGRHTVAQALRLDQPPMNNARRASRPSLLDSHRAQIDALLVKYPTLSAVRIQEEITRGPEAYAGSISLVRRYLRKVRPARGRVYQEVHYDPGQAMQVDWGSCGKVTVGGTSRKVSVLVATLCHSRLKKGIQDTQVYNPGRRVNRPRFPKGTSRFATGDPDAARFRRIAATNAT